MTEEALKFFARYDFINGFKVIEQVLHKGN